MSKVTLRKGNWQKEMDEKKKQTEITLEEQIDDDVVIDMPNEDYSSFSSNSIIVSIQNNKQYVYIGVGILVLIGLISLIAIGVYYFYFIKDNGEPNFDYSEMSTYSNNVKVEVGPGYYENTFSIDSPPDNFLSSISIHQIIFSIEDEGGNTVEVERVFVEELSLSVDFLPIAKIIDQSANNSIAMQLPIPYVITSAEDSQWELTAKLINLWGTVTQANLTLFINYSIVYSNSTSSLPSKLILSVADDILDNNNDNNDNNNDNNDDNNDEEVIMEVLEDELCNHSLVGSGVAKYQCNVSKGNSGGSVIVEAIGLLSPGGVNISLFLHTPGGDDQAYSLIATSIPSYDEEGFILYQQSSFPFFYLNVSNTADYLLEYYYNTSFTYSSSIAKFILYRTPIDQSLPPSPSPSPPPPSSSSPSTSPSPSQTSSTDSSSSVSQTTSSTSSPSTSESPFPTPSSSALSPSPTKSHATSKSQSKSPSPSISFSSSFSPSPVPSSSPSASPADDYYIPL